MRASRINPARQVLAITTMVAVLVSGCASRQTVVPVGQDRSELVATVARRGQQSPDTSGMHQVEGPDKFEPSPEMKVVRDVARTSALVAAGVVLFSPLFILAALGHGSVNLSELRPDLKSDSQ
jgi:hypothetical protein